MGCDFSIAVKQDFANKVDNIESLQSKILERESQLESSITEFSLMESSEIDITSLSNKLSNSIERLEILTQEIQKLKQCKTNDTIKFHKSVEKVKRKNQKELELKEQREKYEDLIGNGTPVTPERNSNNRIYRKGSHKESPKLNGPESILNDPEVMALINKNRNLLLRKLTT